MGIFSARLMKIGPSIPMHKSIGIKNVRSREISGKSKSNNGPYSVCGRGMMHFVDGWCGPCHFSPHPISIPIIRFSSNPIRTRISTDYKGFACKVPGGDQVVCAKDLHSESLSERRYFCLSTGSGFACIFLGT